MSKNNTFGWGAVLVLIVLAGLLLWWWSTTGFSLSYSFEPQSAATSTAPTSETATSSRVAVESRSALTVAQVVAGISGSGKFNAYLAQTGVAAQITGKGPYTVFVPTDGAWNRLPQGTLSAMTAADLKRMVQYHVVVGRTLDIDAVSSGTIQALSKDALNFSVRLSDMNVIVNSSQVITQYKAKNGIVYVINTVLIPPQKATQ